MSNDPNPNPNGGTTEMPSGVDDAADIFTTVVEINGEQVQRMQEAISLLRDVGMTCLDLLGPGAQPTLRCERAVAKVEQVAAKLASLGADFEAVEQLLQALADS